MNRTELTERLAEKAGLTLQEARRAVQALFGASGSDGLIVEALDRGDKVTIPGFGTFLTRARSERRVKDPRTGELRRIAACRVPAFRAGLALRERLR